MTNILRDPERFEGIIARQPDVTAALHALSELVDIVLNICSHHAVVLVAFCYGHAADSSGQLLL